MIQEDKQIKEYKEQKKAVEEGGAAITAQEVDVKQIKYQILRKRQ